jgi:hypothetical protein
MSIITTVYHFRIRQMLLFSHVVLTPRGREVSNWRYPKSIARNGDLPTKKRGTGCGAPWSGCSVRRPKWPLIPGISMDFNGFHVVHVTFMWVDDGR